ncbi:WD40 repeat-like protein [Lactarius psammicola]|nr:WD40 repeat-like protein [Lactarius psammicola]
MTFSSYFAEGFPYSRKLTGHSSCVNALAFSPGDGRWLASAGDDRVIKLWDLHQENLIAPSRSFSALLPCLCHVRGGADDTILKYDLTRYTSNCLDSDGPMQAYNQHNDFIRSVSCHPYQDEIFMSARQPSSLAPFFHPRMEHLFATSDVRGNVRLRDTRMAFGPLRQRTKDGTKLGVAFLHWHPTMYSLTDPYPVAVCSGRNLPDGSSSPPDARTFSDSTTMKHGSFGGSALVTGGEAYYASGSDDFRGYLWKIPALETLENERQIIGADDWLNGGEDGAVAFTGSSYSSDKYVPKELSTPLTRLCGHISIVNTTLIHPVLPVIATAGIERHIILHSPTPSAPWATELPPTPTTTRPLPSGGPSPTDPSVLRLLMRLSTITEVDESMGEDARSIAYFDMILQREGTRDLFSHRPPAMPSDDDADDGHDLVDSSGEQDDEDES